MADGTALQIWYWSLGAVALVIVIAAGLLLGIRHQAAQILSIAVEALGIGGRIIENTKPIWLLHDVSDAAVGLRDTTGSIANRGTALADAVTAHEETAP